MSGVNVSRVRKEFSARGGAVLALDDIDLALAPGEFACLLGPSGCGKSTLLNILAGFEGVTAGEVSVFSARVDKPGPDRAVVFQEAALFPWMSVLDNVTFGPRLAGKPRAETVARARDLLALVGLSGFEKHLPAELSGGMKQRVGIARALILKPKLFLMDEPFGALDAQTRMQMQELLLRVWEAEKGTVLFITHDIDEAIFLADTVHVMTARPGKIRSSTRIELPRPRTLDLLTDARFGAYKADLLAQIREEAGRAQAAITAAELAAH
jgi:NitT/TauT family transport system ATP-binding protein